MAAGRLGLDNKKAFSLPIALAMKLAMYSAMYIAGGLLLVACDDTAPPKVLTPKSSVEITGSVNADSTPSQNQNTQDENINPDEALSPETVSLTSYEGDETPPEETIASIIAQLKLTSPDRVQEDDTAIISNALTNARLKLSVPADPPPNNVTWTLDTDQASDDQIEQDQAIIPEGKDPSLATEALAAAFAMVRQSRKLDDQLISPETVDVTIVKKSDDLLRVAMLIPLSGVAENIGQDIRRGAELAIFTLDNPHIDLTFHDTSKNVEAAVADAITQNADLIIGPLFADNARRAQPIASMAGIPVLSFSNDSTVAGGGIWLIGQTPEQDIEIVLRQALTSIKPIDPKARALPNLIIIAQDNDYGARITQHAIAILKETGVATADLLTLQDEIVADEKSLRASIKNLTGWLPPSSTGEKVLPKYDMVLMAGLEAFSLRVAPVLSWYDLDPEQVQYLGPSLWNNAAILQEPSLSNGWFADIPKANQSRFQQIWQDQFNAAATRPAILAFDAIAMASTLNHGTKEELKTALLNDQGFSGFSGYFRLNPDGSNTRLLEILQIETNTTKVIVPANQQF